MPYLKKKKQLLQYTLLKSFAVPSAVLTEFAKKFYMKLLASAFIFTKLSTKAVLLLRLCVSFEYQGLLQNTPASFLLFLSMLKIHCKRHYRNLTTYSCCTTLREHFTKTAPARRRHSVGGGGAPISYDRRRWRQQNVGGAQRYIQHTDKRTESNLVHFSLKMTFGGNSLIISLIINWPNFVYLLVNPGFYPSL